MAVGLSLCFPVKHSSINHGKTVNLCNPLLILAARSSVQKALGRPTCFCLESVFGNSARFCQSHTLSVRVTWQPWVSSSSAVRRECPWARVSSCPSATWCPEILSKDIKKYQKISKRYKGNKRIWKGQIRAMSDLRHNKSARSKIIDSPANHRHRVHLSHPKQSWAPHAEAFSGTMCCCLGSSLSIAPLGSSPPRSLDDLDGLGSSRAAALHVRDPWAPDAWCSKRLVWTCCQGEKLLQVITQDQTAMNSCRNSYEQPGTAR